MSNIAEYRVRPCFLIPSCLLALFALSSLTAPLPALHEPNRRAEEPKREDSVIAAQARLWAAQDAYDVQVEAIRQGLLKSLEKQDAEARKKADIEMLDEIKVDREALIEFGQWPASVRTPQRETWKTARRAVEGCYKGLAAAYLDSNHKLDDLSKAVMLDLENFSTTYDLGPWHDSPIDSSIAMKSGWKREGDLWSSTTPERDIAPLIATAKLSPACIIQIRLERTSGGGGIVLGVCDPDGKYTRWRCRDGAVTPPRADLPPTGMISSFQNRRCNFTCSFRNGQIAPDGNWDHVEVETPEGEPKSRPAPGSISIQVEKGSAFVVERVRVKPTMPMPAGFFDDDAARPKRPDPKPQVQQSSLADRLAAGSLWQGSMDESAGTEHYTYREAMFVSSGTGKALVCKIWFPTLANGAVADWTGEIDNSGALVITTFQIVYGRARNGVAGLVDCSGKMTFRAVGKGIEGKGELIDSMGKTHSITHTFQPVD